MPIAVGASTGRSVVIVDGVRTPFAKAGGALADVPAHELGRVAVRELLARTELDPARLDEVVLGNCGSPPRPRTSRASRRSRPACRERVPAFTVHRNCASGIEAVAEAALRIAAGRRHGGDRRRHRVDVDYPLLMGPALTEAFARVRARALAAARARAVPRASRPGAARRASRSSRASPIRCAASTWAQTAEVLAREFAHHARGAGRVRARATSARSPRDEGRLAGRGDARLPRRRRSSRSRTTSARAASRRSSSSRSSSPSSTAATARSRSATRARSPTARSRCWSWTRRPRAPRATARSAALRSVAFAGLDPERMGLGPVFATPLALERAGVALADIDADRDQRGVRRAGAGVPRRVRVATTFAREKLGPRARARRDRSRELNVNGGAIALGHPVGVSGARLVLTLLHEMRRRGGGRGLATLCVGGGQGAAVVLESMPEAA